MITPRGVQVLAFSRQEAVRLQHSCVRTEHLLLGLLRLGEGTAVKLLRERGLDLESVRQEVERESKAAPAKGGTGLIPYTPRVKVVIALAGKEAQALGHSYIGTEHILLGLLREGKGTAAGVLRKLGVNFEELSSKLLRGLLRTRRPLGAPEA